MDTHVNLLLCIFGLGLFFMIWAHYFYLEEILMSRLCPDALFPKGPKLSLAK